MQRILNLTHNDLDGLVAAVAIVNAHPTDHTTVRFVGYDDVHEQLKKGLSSAMPYDRIILSDISIKTPDDITDKTPNPDLIRELFERVTTYVAAGGEFVVLDHHETALSLRKGYADLLHPDSIIETQDADGVKRAGSEVAARYLRQKGEEMSDDLQAYMEMSEAFDEAGWSMEDEEGLRERLYELCEIAGEYDTWRDPLGFGGRLAMAISLMDDSVGAYNDLTDLLQMAFHSEATYEDALYAIPSLAYYYELATDKLEEAIEKAQTGKVEHHARFHEIQVEQFPNECAMAVYAASEGVVMVTYPNNPKRLSFRRHADCNVDLSSFCARFGRGGGHAAAAGVTLGDGVTLDEVVAAMCQEVDRATHV